MRSADTEQNVAVWTRINAEHLDAGAHRNWASDEITWGIWKLPERELGVLGDVSGLDVVELGCGTAYFSAWLAKRGARPVAVDPTPAQLETARRLQSETGIEFPLVEAPGESVPLGDAAFDLAVSEHGAATWADPYKWIPGAARLLRPSGRLVFMHTTPLATLCFPDEDGTVTTTLQRPYFGLHRLEWPGADGVENPPAHGVWVHVLVRAGVDVEALVEVQAPSDAATHEYYSHVPAAWARDWPNEEIWVAR